MIRLIAAIVVAMMAGSGYQYSLQKCMNGPTREYEPRSCATYDYDDDGNIDLLDWADWIIDHPDGILDQADP